MSEDDAEDRRQYPRVSVNIRVGIIQSNGDIVYAKIKNISIGGLYILTEYTADIGKIFRIFFKVIINSQPIKIEAQTQVIYVYYGEQSKVYLGMKFIKFKDDGNTTLNQYVSSRLSSNQ